MLNSSSDAATRELTATIEAAPITNDIDTLVDLIKQIEGTEVFKPLIDALDHGNDSATIILSKARTLAHMDTAIAALKKHRANPGRLQELSNLRELFKRAAGLPYDEDAESESELLVTNFTSLLEYSPHPGPSLFSTEESRSTTTEIHRQFIDAIKTLKSPEPPTSPSL